MIETWRGSQTAGIESVAPHSQRSSASRIAWRGKCNTRWCDVRKSIDVALQYNRYHSNVYKGKGKQCVTIILHSLNNWQYFIANSESTHIRTQEIFTHTNAGNVNNETRAKEVTFTLVDRYSTHHTSCSYYIDLHDSSPLPPSLYVIDFTCACGKIGVNIKDTNSWEWVRRHVSSQKSDCVWATEN